MWEAVEYLSGLEAGTLQNHDWEERAPERMGSSLTTFLQGFVPSKSRSYCLRLTLSHLPLFLCSFSLAWIF